MVALIGVKTEVLDHPPTVLISPGTCDGLYKVLDSAVLAMVDHQINRFETIVLNIQNNQDEKIRCQPGVSPGREFFGLDNRRRETRCRRAD